MDVATPVRVSLILAGGGSTRLGRDKRLLQAGAATLLHQAVELAAGVGPVFAQVEPGGVGRLPLIPWLCFLQDPSPREGPLAAVRSALTRLQTSCLVLAVDLPRVQPRDLAQLQMAWEEHPDAVAVPEHADGLEPLCALYPVSCLSWLDQAWSAGERSLQRALTAQAASRVRRVRFPVEPFLNLNRPDDVGHWRSS